MEPACRAASQVTRNCSPCYNVIVACFIMLQREHSSIGVRRRNGQSPSESAPEP